MDLFFRKSMESLRDEAGHSPLKRSLGRLNLTTLGIGSVIGTGIFVLVGTAASQNAGPSLVFTYTLSGTTLTVAGASNAYDFNGDLVDEAATRGGVFVKR